MKEQESTGVVDRALSLLNHLRVEEAPLTLSELSRRTGLAKSTALRLLTSLTTSGLVERVGYRYRTSPFIVAPQPTTDVDLRLLAPHVGDLFVRTRQTCSVAVLRGPDVLYAHRIYGRDAIRTTVDDTGRSHPQATAAGRLLLAYHPAAARQFAPGEMSCGSAELTRIKQRRYAAVSHSDGVVCLAVPVFGSRGLPVAALTMRGRHDQVDQSTALHWMHLVGAAASHEVIRTTTAIDAACGVPGWTSHPVSPVRPARS